jgi:iron complex transport system substrate-binding protein
MRRHWAKSFFAPVAAVIITVITTLLSPPGSGLAAPLTAERATPPAAASGFPVVVKSADGNVTIPHRPTRILSLSASATQMLYAIGAESQVVGVDKYSWYPPDAPRTKFTGAETSAEDYLYLHPDLVVLAYQTGNVVPQLKLLHIPVLVLPAATNFSDVDGQLAELGAATGHLRGAEAAASSLSAATNRAVAEAGKAHRGQTYYVELDPAFYSATSRTFIGAELSLFGLRNIADAAGHGTAWPQVSAEFVLKANPQWVFLADTVCCHADAANFARRPGFSILRAVRLHHVIGINDSLASEWGPHSIEGLLDVLATALRS